MATSEGWCEHPNQSLRFLPRYGRRAQVLPSARTLMPLLVLVTGIHHLRAGSGYCRNMARQSNTEKRVATAVRLPKSLHHQLQDQAELRDVSVNFLVVRAVTQYLQNAPDPLALEGSAARST